MKNQSNLLLKGMVSKTDKYMRKSLVEYLHVDIQNCEPELNPKYDSSMKDNIFIFLDENNYILGFLQGSQPLKKFNERFARHTDFTKNRKHLTINATNVLMLTEEMRKFKLNTEKPLTKYQISQQAKNDLQKRLTEYKAAKFNNLTHDDINNMITNTLMKLANNVNNNDIVNEIKNSKLTFGFTTNIFRLIADFSKLSEEYTYNYDMYDEQNKKYGKNFLNNYYYDNVLECRNNIIKWNRIVSKY